jgi:hypothetical protein
MRPIVSGVLAVVLAALFAVPGAACAQSTDEDSARRAVNALLRNLPDRVVPAPPGRGLDWLAPGLGGLIPGLGRGRNDPEAGEQLRRIPRACAPGGALSGEAVHGQFGRNHARGRVCSG